MTETRLYRLEGTVEVVVTAPSNISVEELMSQFKMHTAGGRFYCKKIKIGKIVTEEEEINNGEKQ